MAFHLHHAHGLILRVPDSPGHPVIAGLEVERGQTIAQLSTIPKCLEHLVMPIVVRWTIAWQLEDVAKSRFRIAPARRWFMEPVRLRGCFPPGLITRISSLTTRRRELGSLCSSADMDTTASSEASATSDRLDKSWLYMVTVPRSGGGLRGARARANAPRTCLGQRRGFRDTEFFSENIPAGSRSCGRNPSTLHQALN
jgi:hypothetical protein